MRRSEIIETLKMENELMCFNPLTGRDFSPEFLNELNKSCYRAHEGAIKLLGNSIPIEFVEKMIGEYDDWNENIEPLIDLIKRWEKEKENGEDVNSLRN